MKKLVNIQDLNELRESIIEKNKRYHRTITICGGPGCHAIGSEDLRATFEQEIKKRGLEDRIRLIFSGCHGFCEQGPLAVISFVSKSCCAKVVILISFSVLLTIFVVTSVTDSLKTLFRQKLDK